MVPETGAGVRCSFAPLLVLSNDGAPDALNAKLAAAQQTIEHDVQSRPLTSALDAGRAGWFRTGMWRATTAMERQLHTCAWRSDVAIVTFM